MAPAVAHESSVDTSANVVNKSETSPGVNNLATGESPQSPTKMTDATRNFQVSAFLLCISLYRCIDNNSYCNLITVGGIRILILVFSLANESISSN